jgi:hypothetical protein
LQEIICSFWMLIDSCVRLCRRNFVRERQSLIGFDFRWRGDKIGETRRRSSRDENARNGKSQADYFFTLRPSPTRRRMASARLRFPRHASNLAMNSSDRRNVRAGSRPVGFRPEPGRGPPCFFGIAFSMSRYYRFQA